LPGLQDIGTGSFRDIGTALVSAYGGNHRGALNNWAPAGTGMRVEVACRSSGGLPQDGVFTLLYYRESVNRYGHGDRVGAYLLADEFGTPLPPRKWWSSLPSAEAPTVEVYYQDDVIPYSEYYVDLYHPAYVPGLMFLTPIDSGGDYCTQAGVMYGVGLIQCWDARGAASSTTRFALSYMWDYPTEGVAIGLASGLPWHDGAIAPVPKVTSGCVGIPLRRDSGGDVSGRTACATGSPGETVVTLEVRTGGRSTVHVQAVGYREAKYCSVVRWAGTNVGGPGGTTLPVTITVRCYNADGEPTASEFDLLYLNDVPA